MNEVLEVSFFKNGSENFIELLNEKNVPFEKIQLFSAGTIVASGEIIQLLTAIGGLSLAPSIAAVIVQWLKNKKSRKVILQTKNKDVVYLEGLSVKEVEKILSHAERISIIQPEDD